MQINDIKSFFTAADTNNNGFLTAKELRKAVSSQTTDVQKVLSTFLNEKGKIDSAKFNMASGGDKQFSYNEIVSLLTTTDEDDNVKIVDDDTLTGRLSNISNLSSIDKNKDGRISESEILKAYNNTATGEMKELLANFITTNAKGKVVVDKAKVRVLSGGNKYLSMTDLLKTDTDKNQAASKDEVSTYLTQAAGFTSIDTNGDGKLTSKEILKLYNDATTSTEVKALLSNFIKTNAKGKNQVDMAKLRALSGGKKFLTYQDFLKTDADSSKDLDPTEVKEYLGKVSEFTTLDLNGDGKVTLSEMKKYAKNSSESPLSSYIASLASSKEMKRVFKILSDGKSYLTTEDIAKYDTNGNGVICTGELASFKKDANGIVKTTTVV